MTRPPAAVAALLLLLVRPGPAPAAPIALTGLFPPGSARGTTTTVTASGTFDRWPVSVWVDGPGVSVEPGPAKGALVVQVAADASPGVRWVRLVDAEGATSLRPFIVGTLPEVAEAEPNDDPGKAQVVSPPSVTVNGRLARAGDVDGYSIRLDTGQTLVADLDAARSLASPMDAVLQIATPDGFVLAQNDDTTGRDPRIVFKAPRAGAFVVRAFAFPSTPDSSIRFAGGDAYVYRLTLTTAGFLDRAFPPAGPGPATLEGLNIPSNASSWMIPPGDPGLATIFHPALAGSATVRRLPGRVGVESEPNDPAHPQDLAGLTAIAGRIDPPGDRDAFKVALRKGESRIVRVESRGFGLPLDPVVRVLDPSGKTLAELDDSGKDADPELTFKAAVDGDHRVVVSDLFGRGGPRHAYLLRLVAPEPDFALILPSDRFEATPGRPTSLTLTIERRAGFTGTIEIRLADAPEGIAMATAASKSADSSAKSVKLELIADGCAHPGPFRIVGTASGPSPTSRTAASPIAGFGSTTDRPWLTIRPLASPKP